MQTRLAHPFSHMSERDDVGDPEDGADAESADPADRSTTRHGNAEGRTHDVGADHAVAAGADREETNEAHGGTESREAEAGEPPTAERLEEIISRVTHDLKSQLIVAHRRLDMAHREVDSDDLAEVATALDRMDVLIEGLQEGAVEGMERTETERVLLPTLADQCWRNVAANGATLHNTSTLPLRANPSGLKRVLENLFRNAVEHNDAGVRVEIGDLDEANGFYVADDGSGIPESVRDSVFEPGVSTGRDATGLGLSIVAQIAETHDWQIRISESDAGGTRFDITRLEVATA